MNKSGIYAYVSIISIILAFIFLFLRYFIYFPFIYSVDDFLWMFSAVFLMKYLITERIYYIIPSFLILMVVIFDELFQRYVYPLIGINVGTFSIYDIISYISAFITAIIVITIIQRKDKYEN